jgi:hypothetical protein
MSISNMPMFELFPPLFKSKQIEQWTANEFWKHLKLSKKERNRFNRQLILDSIVDNQPL